MELVAAPVRFALDVPGDRVDNRTRHQPRAGVIQVDDLATTGRIGAPLRDWTACALR
jgi:hypothetical protein